MSSPTNDAAAVAPGPKPTPRLVIRPDPEHELGIYCMWIGSGGNYMLHWGDGSSDPMTWHRPPKNHVYAQSGRYQVRAIAQHNPEHHAEAWIDVPIRPPEPKPTFWAGVRETAVKWPSTLLGGTWRIYWPDWEPQDLTPTAETWYYAPTVPGQRTVQVTHLSSGTTHTSGALTVADYDYVPTAQIEIAGTEVTVTRTGPASLDHVSWDVYWGDEWETGIARRPDQLVDHQASHTYEEPGNYFLELSCLDGGRVYVGVWEVSV